MRSGRQYWGFGAAWLAIGLMLACPAKSMAGDTLFRRYAGNPIFRYKRDSRWYQVHIANAAVLTPEESPDRSWRVYIRGSSHYPGEDPDPRRNYHDQIGLFTQDSRGFSPYGPWLEYSKNPVLTHGPAGACDAKHALDCAPVLGGNGLLYLYYTAVDLSGGKSLAGACSADGGYTFTKFPKNPLKRHVGANDAVCQGGRYYIYYGDAKYDPETKRLTDRLKIYVAVTRDPGDLSEADVHLAIDVGPAGSFDSFAVNGARLFRLKSKWFMIYQASDVHFDYPNRFHAAYSEDLIHWTKVRNSVPLFERGESGQWDQGAIWFGEAFEHEGTLYMFYEGWGCERRDVNRDRAYFRPGRSQTGIASVSVADFLKWSGAFGGGGGVGEGR